MQVRSNRQKLLQSGLNVLQKKWRMENLELVGIWGGSFTSHANYPKIGCSACVATVKNTHDVVTDCYCPNYRESGCAKLAGDRSKKQKECRAEEGGYVFSDMG